MTGAGDNDVISGHVARRQRLSINRRIGNDAGHIIGWVGAALLGVIGLLPVVGLPLPMISYGGTSIVTLMAGFGILMSIQTHRKLLPT